MKLIDFAQLGGYRLKQPTFAKMQAAYFEILKALVGVLGLPDAGNFIVYGCEISGADITPGIMYIDGELCPFAGAPGTLATKIKKNISITTLAFKNGSNPGVFRDTTAVVDAAGAALSTFIRQSIVLDANYVHTDNNFTTPLKDKLDGIEAGAEKNIQADWSQVNALADDFIKNKPTILNVLHKSQFALGDFPSPGPQEQVTVPLSVNVGTSDYMVIGMMESLGSPTIDNNVWWMVKNCTPTSFDLLGEEIDGGTQNLMFHYIIIGN
jgi:hypothetical protein